MNVVNFVRNEALVYDYREFVQNEAHATKYRLSSVVYCGRANMTSQVPLHSKFCEEISKFTKTIVLYITTSI